MDLCEQSQNELRLWALPRLQTAALVRYFFALLNIHHVAGSRLGPRLEARRASKQANRPDSKESCGQALCMRMQEHGGVPGPAQGLGEGLQREASPGPVLRARAPGGERSACPFLGFYHLHLGTDVHTKKGASDVAKREIAGRTG